MRGLRRDAERAQIAETVSKTHALFPRFSQERGAVIIQAPGLLHIGRAASLVWADPPNGGCTAQRHVQGTNYELFIKEQSATAWVGRRHRDLGTLSEQNRTKDKNRAGD